MRATVTKRVALAGRFVGAAHRYWLDVFPLARRELRRWRRRAAEIPDPALRHHALATHWAKGAHPEGAAAFAVLAERSARPAVVQALVTFQAMYDYLDTVSEQPGADLLDNGRQLHRALIVAVDPRAPHLDYYSLNPNRDDGGYLRELLDDCRNVCELLPSYALVARSLRHAARRAMESQGLNHSAAPEPLLSHDSVAHWAMAEAPPQCRLEWWELIGAAGSSLVILALLAAASDPNLSESELVAIEALYFPWAGALLALVDSLVDQADDASAGQHSLVVHYESPGHAAERLGAIGSRALELTRQLARGDEHALIIAAMASMFLSRPEASRPQALPARQAILAAMGDLASPMMYVFKARRRAARLLQMR